MSDETPLAHQGFTWSNQPQPEEPDVVDKMAALEDPDGDAGQRVKAFKQHQDAVELDVKKLMDFCVEHKDDDRAIIVDATTEGSFMGVFRLDKLGDDEDE